MSYCLFEHWRGTGARALGTEALGRWTRDTAWARGAAWARAEGAGRTGHDVATRPAGRPGRGLCVQAGPSWCTVHLAQFWLSF